MLAVSENADRTATCRIMRVRVGTLFTTVPLDPVARRTSMLSLALSAGIPLRRWCWDSGACHRARRA